jgi:hypothetical protein
MEDLPKRTTIRARRTSPVEIVDAGETVTAKMTVLDFFCVWNPAHCTVRLRNELQSPQAIRAKMFWSLWV